MQDYRLFIDNEWVAPASGEYFETEDPYSGIAWAQVPRGSEKDVEQAVSAASAALEGPWSALSASERGKLLHRLGSLIEANAQHLAEIECRDNGKLMSEVAGQVRYVAEWFYYYA